MECRHLLSCLSFLLAIGVGASQDFDEFVEHFSSCKWNSTGFDKCVRDGINAVRPFFKTGVPEMDLGPFDPFFAKEVVQQRGGSNFRYKLVLKNVTESGWSESLVTKFKSNTRKRFVQYSQFFPEKFLMGEYEFEGHFMNNHMENKGIWNLTLYDYTQTTTMSKPLGAKNIKVHIAVNTIGDLKLHISNLLRGRTLMEGMLDRIINTSWRAGFRFIRPLINDMVSSAFTEIFNNNFREFDFNKIWPSDTDYSTLTETTTASQIE